MVRDGELGLEIGGRHLESSENHDASTMTTLTLNCSASKDDLSGAASLDSTIRRSSTGWPSERQEEARS